ncbi:helix-turn-helix transcriptional regulator [Martelella lutilitoris]|uniref:Helix-turn-helix transcriptional regulator n=1 Tax=Martelella lutilitoris TaxID=2583532 RepID=A0A5C4JM68_9HYPH|nr:AraC family transcriptional regulator [Martelella lutilitoris]TNB46400.1 helix-turn-helix transcriptional regulator [Martelella lutilitoris]
MLVLPVPMVTALVLGFMVLRMLAGERRPLAIAVFLSACALQGLIVALVQYYGVAFLQPVQPVTASVVPVCAWLAFRSSFIEPIRPGRDFIHLVAPTFTLFCVLFAPVTVDAIIPLVFLAYGARILLTLKTGGDALPLARLEAGRQPQWLWTGIAASLLLSAVSDTLIAYVIAAGAPALKPLIVSIFTSAALLAAGLLSLSPNAFGEGDPKEAARPFPPEASEADTAIVARLDALMRAEPLYLDPALTLSRLARRLKLPAKTLSTAINRVTGENVSRHINRFRIEHACKRLKAGDTVTTAMLSSGFNTKSNFNREFTRLTGKSPTAWLDGQT